MPHRSLTLEEACVAIGATPTRLRTLRYVMAHRDATANDIVEALGLSRSNVHHHLTALRDAGILHERRATHPRGSGPIIYWTVDQEHVHAIRNVLFEHLS